MMRTSAHASSTSEPMTRLRRRRRARRFAARQSYAALRAGTALRISPPFQFWFPASKPVDERLPFPIARKTPPDLRFGRAPAAEERPRRVCKGRAVDRDVIVMAQQVQQKMGG